jgi:hypothetical protein
MGLRPTQADETAFGPEIRKRHSIERSREALCLPLPPNPVGQTTDSDRLSPGKKEPEDKVLRF